MGQTWKWYALLLPYFHWVELSHMTAINDKGGWKIKPTCVSGKKKNLVLENTSIVCHTYISK